MLLKKFYLPKLLNITLLIFLACATPEELRTDDIPAVNPFDLERFLGNWYEIARLPNSFEKGLENVTASYELDDDGEILVLNRGFSMDNDEWKEARGRAWVPDTTNPAYLKVSFFWIFSSDYKIIELDQDKYSYAMVTSNSKDYLWILSRKPYLTPDIYEKLLAKASNLGFNTSNLHKVTHH